jgi:tRNA A-37 threonylcarbamoyl transferase component Bud32
MPLNTNLTCDQECQSVLLETPASSSAAAGQSDPEPASLEPPAITCPQTGELHFTPVTQIGSKLKQKLQNNQRAAFLYFLVATIAIKLACGTQALAIILFWMTILFILTRLNVLAANFVVSVEEFGLVIMRRHWLGQETLKLPWHKIAGIEEIADSSAEPREIKVSLKKGAVSIIDSLVFQDIRESSKVLSMRTECLSAWQSAGPGSERTEAQQIETGRRDFFLRLFHLSPAGLVSKQPTQQAITGGKATVLGSGEEGFVVPYLTVNQGQKQFLKLLRRAEKYLMPLLCLTALACLILLGAQTMLSALSGIVVFLVMIVLAVREASKTLTFTDAGITVIWSGPGYRQRSRPIPWDAVEDVSCSTQFAGESVERQLIEFRLNTRSPGANHVRILQDRYVSGGLFCARNSQSFLSLNTGGLKDAGSRQDLLAALRRYLKPEQVDSSVREALNPCDLSSYTQLWLTSLGNTPRRRLDGKLAPGQQLKNGSFEILEFLAAGGQANVYLASCASACFEAAPPGETSAFAKTRAVVLKEFILPCHAGQDLSLRSLNNIVKEQELMQKLQHPKIVRCHDIFVEDHRCYLVLEHVDGRCLRSLVEETGPLAESEVLALAVQMAEILAHLHGQTPPVVHRDFTPENLMLSGNGVLKLIDFNVARELEENATRTMVGKHGYLPPEQFRGRSCPQSDIYALGATLYFLLTGEEPEPITCLHPALKEATVSPGLDAAVAHATELELSSRFSGAVELLHELKRLSGDEPENISAESPEPPDKPDQPLLS